MPTFKHPCPHCGKFINRDVAACPYCATPDPFAPARCPNCRTPIDDTAWAACPRCGQALKVATTPATAPQMVPSPNQPPAEAYLNPAVPPPAPTGSPAPTQTAGATPTPTAVSSAASQASPAANCTGCGAPLSPGARFCTVCGTLAG